MSETDFAAFERRDPRDRTVMHVLYLLLFIPGIIAHAIVGLWYLYRCIRGWLRFNDNRPPT